jgi:hypothetical protein
MHQTERPDELQVSDGEPVFHDAQRAIRAVLSIERSWRAHLTTRFELFCKSISDPLPIYENLLDTLIVLPELEVDRVRVAPRSSRAYGAELSGRWEPTARWSNWFSYSWSEVTDRFDEFKAPRSWDQQQSVTTGAAWVRGPWHLSGSLRWHSGWRRTELERRATTVSGASPTLIASQRNALRYDDQFSLDLRATASRPLPRGNLKVYAEVNNAINRENACRATYELATIGGALQLERDMESSPPRYGLIGVLWELP